jgi:hypothetical protein
MAAAMGLSSISGSQSGEESDSELHHLDGSVPCSSLKG